MPRELEDAENPDKPDDPEYCKRGGGVVVGHQGGGQRGGEGQEVGDDGEEINDVENISEELAMIRTREETQNEF